MANTHSIAHTPSEDNFQSESLAAVAEAKA